MEKIALTFVRVSMELNVTIVMDHVIVNLDFLEKNAAKVRNKIFFVHFDEISVCPSGRFGVDCMQLCKCQNGALCNSEDGSCECLPGSVIARTEDIAVLKMVNAFVLLEKKVISVMIPVKAVVLEQVAVASVNARTVQLVILSPDLAIANLDGKGNTVRNRVQMGDLVLDAIQFVPAPSQIVPWHKIFIQQVAIMLQENAGVLLGGQVQAVRHRAH
uniref:EGF-like domain-containing protein n=1 Tax=Caenorhabditis japonica TaxID=281687 RepID=A0A8R1HYF2_CAEJA